MSTQQCTSLLGFGNNACRNIDPAGQSVIDSPQVINVDCGELIWHSWSCTVGKSRDGCLVWGQDPLVMHAGPTPFRLDRKIKQILGWDRPIGYMHEDGHISTLDGEMSVTVWHDVVVNALGDVYAANDAGTGIFRFETIEDLLNGNNAFGPLSHPLLRHNRVKLYTTESRTFITTTGSSQHLLEIIDMRSLPPRQVKTTDPVMIKIIDELEGLGIRAFIPGSANRAAVITEAGEAWLIPFKGDIEPLEFGQEDVRLAGIGSEFEVIVTDRDIYVRGKSMS